jgi:ABC-2 type transport system ATP-binding protein
MPSIVMQTQGLCKRYGALLAVDNLNLDVFAGEIFGFLGPNGAGKTTSISMMCGLLRPDAGEVRIQGKPVHGGDVEARARVGVCPQSTVLWEKLTCLEQLQFVGEMYGVPGKLARQRGEDLLTRLDLVEKRRKLAGTLSGGMKRRLNIALALVHDPDIVVLDEPEAGLDPQSRLLVREFIRSLAQTKTIILTTHNMDEADRLADRVAIIDHGKLLVVDTPDRLKQTIREGEVLEVEIGGIPVELAQQAAAGLAPHVSTRNHTLLIRSQALVEKLPAILEALHNTGACLGEVRLRPNTLEDVFIHLTGRRLRE